MEGKDVRKNAGPHSGMPLACNSILSSSHNDSEPQFPYLSASVIAKIPANPQINDASAFPETGSLGRLLYAG